MLASEVFDSVSWWSPRNLKKKSLNPAVLKKLTYLHRIASAEETSPEKDKHKLSKQCLLILVASCNNITTLKTSVTEWLWNVCLIHTVTEASANKKSKSIQKLLVCFKNGEQECKKNMQIAVIGKKKRQGQRYGQSLWIHTSGFDSHRIHAIISESRW